MRLAAFASLVAAGLTWLALGGVPASSQTADADPSCQTCRKSKACPHCAATKDCPHCDRAGEGAGSGHHHAHHGHAPRWEYKCVRAGKKPEALGEQLTGLGTEGWRLIDGDGGTWCLGRAVRSR